MTLVGCHTDYNHTIINLAVARNYVIIMLLVILKSFVLVCVVPIM